MFTPLCLGVYPSVELQSSVIEDISRSCFWARFCPFSNDFETLSTSPTSPTFTTPLFLFLFFLRTFFVITHSQCINFLWVIFIIILSSFKLYFFSRQFPTPHPHTFKWNWGPTNSILFKWLQIYSYMTHFWRICLIPTMILLAFQLCIFDEHNYFFFLCHCWQCFIFPTSSSIWPTKFTKKTFLVSPRFRTREFRVEVSHSTHWTIVPYVTSFYGQFHIYSPFNLNHSIINDSF